MAELLPCPFCGGEPDEYEGMYGNGIYCMECGAMVGEPIHNDWNVDGRVTYEQAAAAWNTRAAMEFDNWFYLPKPKKEIIYTSETMVERTEHGYRMGAIADVYENAVSEWKEQLNQHIVERICEVFSKDKTCYSERDDCWECSECGFLDAYAMKEAYNYCPSCGRKVEKWQS